MGRYTKLGVIAGGGALPLRIADECAARGDKFHVMRLAGLADSALKRHEGEECGLAEAGRLMRGLKAAGCDAVVFAGVVPRPNFTLLKPDWRGAALLPKVIAAATKGDGALLRVLVETLEAEGFIVVGAEEVMRSLATGAGVLGAHAPANESLEDMKKGAQIVRALGPFDVGQGAIVAAGQVLAIEAAEGTDAMLVRCARLSRGFHGEGARVGVLVKRPKPGQELRVDLPTIGIETVVHAAAAGLAGVAIEAGATLVIDLPQTIAEADRLGLFLYGFRPEEVMGP